MAKDRKKLIHIHSSVFDKQPIPAALEMGEIAVNNSNSKEFLSIKNENNKIVRFSSDEQIVNIMENKEVMPYAGYVRGEDGPGATSADTPTADARGSYGITNNDLLNNKSNIVVKLNQVAAGNTVKHRNVNGAKDAYNKLVNPTTDGGLTDGAGFFIDMSRYAMQDANPSFSSTTNTCRTTMSGTTIIRGIDGACGSLLDIKVNSAKTDIETANTEITSAVTTIGNATTTVSGNATLNVNGTTDFSSGNLTEAIAGNYTTTVVGNMTIMTSGNTAIHSDDSLGITSKENITAVSSESDVIITANKNLCTTAGYNATIYGDDITNVGVKCDGTGASTETVVGGNNINISGTTINESGTNVNINSPTTNITGVLNVFSGLGKTLSWTYDDVCNAISGETNFKDNKLFRIPNSVGHLKRETLTFSYGDVSNEYSITYDPGENNTNNCTSNIGVKIPKSIDNLTNWNGTCINLPHNVCVEGTITATNGMYTSSDRELKTDIKYIRGEEIARANKVELKSFYYKNDASKRKTYGVIAQDVENAGLEELVHYDDKGVRSVDYTGLLLLKIASLEKEISILKHKIEEKNN